MWRYGQYCQADWISTYAFAWHCYADEVRAGEILVMGWFLYCICMLCLDCLHLYVSLPLERYKLYCAEQKSDLDDCSDAQRVLNKSNFCLKDIPTSPGLCFDEEKVHNRWCRDPDRAPHLNPDWNFKLNKDLISFQSESFCTTKSWWVSLYPKEPKTRTNLLSSAPSEKS